AEAGDGDGSGGARCDGVAAEGFDDGALSESDESDDDEGSAARVRSAAGTGGDGEIAGRGEVARREVAGEWRDASGEGGCGSIASDGPVDPRPRSDCGVGGVGVRVRLTKAVRARTGCGAPSAKDPTATTDPSPAHSSVTSRPSSPSRRSCTRTSP